MWFIGFGIDSMKKFICYAVGGFTDKSVKVGSELHTILLAGKTFEKKNRMHNCQWQIKNRQHPSLCVIYFFFICLWFPASSYKQSCEKCVKVYTVQMWSCNFKEWRERFIWLWKLCYWNVSHQAWALPQSPVRGLGAEDCGCKVLRQCTPREFLKIRKAHRPRHNSHFPRRQRWRHRSRLQPHKSRLQLGNCSNANAGIPVKRIACKTTIRGRVLGRSLSEISLSGPAGWLVEKKGKSWLAGWTLSHAKRTVSPKVIVREYVLKYALGSRACGVHAPRVFLFLFSFTSFFKRGSKYPPLTSGWTWL